MGEERRPWWKNKYKKYCIWLNYQLKYTVIKLVFNICASHIRNCLLTKTYLQVQNSYLSYPNVKHSCDGTAEKKIQLIINRTLPDVKTSHWLHCSYRYPLSVSWYSRPQAWSKNLLMSLWINNKYLRKDSWRSTGQTRLYKEWLKDISWPKLSQNTVNFLSLLLCAVARTDELWPPCDSRKYKHKRRKICLTDSRFESLRSALQVTTLLVFSLVFI